VFIKPSHSLISSQSNSRPLFPQLDRIEIEASLPSIKSSCAGHPLDASPIRSTLTRNGFSFSRRKPDLSPSKDISYISSIDLCATGFPVNDDIDLTESQKLSYSNSKLSTVETMLWPLPVSKSTTRFTKQKYKDKERKAESSKIYTEGTNKVISLKLADNMAFNTERHRISTPVLSPSSKELEYLQRRMRSKTNAIDLFAQTNEKSKSVLAALPEEYYDSDSLQSDSYASSFNEL
jgi:hypothetical protein